MRGVFLIQWNEEGRQECVEHVQSLHEKKA
jgi:hypothetical protein